MKKNTFAFSLAFALLFSGILMVYPIAGTAHAATAQELNREGIAALDNLMSQSQIANDLAQRAVGILVFPGIYKAGFVVGAQLGEGVLLVKRQPAGYFRTTGGSYGLQAGAQKYGYVLMFMSQDALNYVKRSKGWEIGTGPSVVVVDKGAGKNLTSTTAKEDVYAFVFDQKGLMAGIGLQGNKISKIEK